MARISTTKLSLCESAGNQTHVAWRRSELHPPKTVNVAMHLVITYTYFDKQQDVPSTFTKYVLKGRLRIGVRAQWSSKITAAMFWDIDFSTSFSVIFETNKEQANKKLKLFYRRVSTFLTCWGVGRRGEAKYLLRQLSKQVKMEAM